MVTTQTTAHHTDDNNIFGDMTLSSKTLSLNALSSNALSSKEHRSNGTLVEWNIGRMEHWSNGTLVERNIFLMVRIG